MALLRALIRTARMARHTASLAAGLPADDEVLLDAPDDRLGPALVAAGQGEHRPAAELLAATREGAEWEDRDRYAMRLAAFAGARPEWLDRWRSTAPDDPDVLLLTAERAVAVAWEGPGPARADLLQTATPLVTAAAEGDPRDPVPWRVALDHARGLAAPHPPFEELWAEAVRRSPHHYGCHVAALRFLAAAGGEAGHVQCFDFAERAAHDALPDSLVQALPVRAVFGHLASRSGPGAVPRARLDAAADRGVALSARYPPGDPWPAEVRNLLVCVLVRLERWHEALEQLRRTGPHATSFPWDRFSDDPLGRFLELRDGVRTEVAAATPLRARPGRAPSGDH
ncbi:hypothetical protein JNUCC64_26625 [Streptomyces sp. JNUCC 64]